MSLKNKKGKQSIEPELLTIRIKGMTENGCRKKGITIFFQSQQHRFVEVFDRYDRLTDLCRRQIRYSLRADPEASALLPFFLRGKFMRSLLVFMAAEALGGNPEDALPGAIAVELCHGTSLIHDDIIDRADTRRGIKAIHKTVGEGRAIVLGDYLLLKAIQWLAEADLPTERVARAVSVLARQGVTCCLGQYQELTDAVGAPTEQLAVEVIKGKTCSLLIGALEVGAVLAVGDVPELGLLREYGEALGLVFQVHDDMLDLLGDANAMGKPTGNSLTQVRPMLPLIYLEQYGTSEQLHLFQRWQQGLIPSPEEVRRCLTESGALAAVERFQQVQIDRAHGVLSQLPSSRGVDGLKQVLAYAVSRSY